MSTLVIVDCNNSVYQSIRTTRHIDLVALRPRLYLHGSPSGTIKVAVQNSSGLTIAESSDQTITDLKTNTYAHGYYRFYITASLVKDEDYRFCVICGGGYSFSESAYVGVCTDWDSTKSQLDYTPSSAFEYPLDFEAWERINL